jgi:HlyD family secretion protein
METDLKSLKIDRNRKRTAEPSAWATRWIIGGVLIFLVLGAARFAYSKFNAAPEVETVRVTATQSGGAQSEGDIVLNATGYIVAHHKIEVAAKVIGRVAWIGVEKGDKVTQGQVIVRLEDDEYRAQLLQAKGNLLNLQARLTQLLNGSRPEEIEVSSANLKQAIADMDNAKFTFDRTASLAKDGVMAKQALDDAKGRYDGAVAHVRSLEKTDSLARLGPRKEEIEAARGAVDQARGVVDYAQTQLDNTIIKAPSSGTIL